MKIKLRYVQSFADRHGQVRHYFRRPGHQRVPLPGLVGSPSFLAAYNMALAADRIPVGSDKHKAGSMAALGAAYLASVEFTSPTSRPGVLPLDQVTQHRYRKIIEAIVAEHGHRLVADLKSDHVEAILTAKAAHAPTQANHWRAALRKLMEFAVAKRWRRDDPTTGVKRVPYKIEGHARWTDTDVAAFERHFPLGTMPNLALRVMLHSGCRVSDASRLGPQHVKLVADPETGMPTKCLVYTQHKNRNRKPVTVTTPIHADLLAAIEAMPAGNNLAFVLTERGRPFKSAASLGTWMRKRCQEAGLPDGLSSHGLRKAFACRAAEFGATPHQIRASGGWAGLKQVENYTKDVQETVLSFKALRTVSGGKK
jgi:integrase